MRNEGKEEEALGEMVGVLVLQRMKLQGCFDKPFKKRSTPRRQNFFAMECCRSREGF